MCVFRQCLLLAAGDSWCPLLRQCCWSSRCYRFGSIVSTHAELGQFGYCPEMGWRRRSWRKAASWEVWIRKARRSCSVSISMQLLLLSTKLTLDLRRANEEYPVAQILSTTSRIFIFIFTFCFFFFFFFLLQNFLLNFIQNTLVFLTIFVQVVLWFCSFMGENRGYFGILIPFDIWMERISKKMDDHDLYRSGEF